MTISKNVVYTTGESIRYGAKATLNNIVIKDNEFHDCVKPVMTGAFQGTGPVFTNNTYVNCRDN